MKIEREKKKEEDLTKKKEMLYSAAVYTGCLKLRSGTETARTKLMPSACT